MQSQSLSSLWSISSGKPVLCVSSSKDGGQIAVGTTDACLVLDAAKGGSRVLTSDADKGPITAVAFAKEGQLLTGGQGTLRLWDVPAAKVLATLELGAKLGEAEADEAVFLAAQPSGELFGVAAEHGRRVCIVDGDLHIQSEVEVQPNCGSLSELSWLSNSSLLATSSGGIQTWVHTEGQSQPSLILGRSIGLVAARPSPDGSTLAAGSRDGVVYLWSLVEGDTQEGADVLSADLRSTLKDYSDEVQLLRWDKAGRYLVTADGSEATVWDVPKLFEQPVQSVICSGHEPYSSILCAVFQDDGPILATGGSDGKVLFFNSALFQAGQVSQPCAAAQNIPSGDGVACIAWLPGGQLVAGTQGGKVVLWQLQPAAFEETPSSPVSERVECSTQEADSTVVSKPPVDAPEPAALNGFNGRRPLGRGFARPALRASTDGGTPRMSSIPDAATNAGAGRLNRAARGPLSVSKDMSSSLPMERNASMPSTRGVREALAPAGRQGDSLGINESVRSTSLQDAQGLTRRTTSLERQQLSPSLMQHIQRVQQKPTATNRSREPAGWGMGSPSAATSAAQMPFVGPGGVVPFNAAPAPSQMPPGFMMFPNQAAAMGPQQMMPAYGFPPAMAPMPMMPHAHSQQQGGKPMPAMQPGMQAGMPPGMVYMPMGAPAMPQQQWQMVQGPWMGHYFMPPSQHHMPDQHLNLMAAGRSSSAPEGPLAYRAAMPRHTSELASTGSLQNTASSGSMPDVREELSKNAISLPDALGNEWRSERGSPVPSGEVQHPAPAQCAADPAAQQTGGAEHKVQAHPEREAASASADKESVRPKESQERQDSHETGRQQSWTPPAEGPRTNPNTDPATGTGKDELEHISESSTPVVTVYVGNLPPTVDEVALMVPFSYFGTITNIQVIRDKNSLQSRGFAFVSYSQPMFAASAIQNMNGRILYGSFRGRALKVGPSNRVI